MRAADIDPSTLLLGPHAKRRLGRADVAALVRGLEGRHVRQWTDDTACQPECRYVLLGPIDIGLLEIPGHASMEAVREADAAFVIQFQLRGTAHVDLEGIPVDVTPEAGVVVPPGIRFGRESFGGWLLSIRIDGAFLRTRLAQRLGHVTERELEFRPQIDAALGELLGFALIIIEAIDRGVAVPGGATSEVLQAAFVDLLLEVQPHNYSDALSITAQASKSRRIAAVAEYIAGHAGEPISMADLATVAGCSARSLQLTFAEHCRMSPIGFLLRRRLAMARALLQAGGGISVSEVAAKVGLSHPSRFAAEYRRVYGERPSETLAQTVSRQRGNA